MLSYGLNYIQIRNEKGEYQYQLDPPIQKLSFFSDGGASYSSQKGGYSYRLCQIVSHLVKFTSEMVGGLVFSP